MLSNLSQLVFIIFLNALSKHALTVVILSLLTVSAQCEQGLGLYQIMAMACIGLHTLL